MRIDWDTPIDILMHGDDVAYIDLEEDEMMHWKYIKRKKLPNGKWRYYYDIKDALGFNKKEALEKADQDYKRASKEADDFQIKATKEQNKAVAYNPTTDKLEYKTEFRKQAVSELSKQHEQKLKAETEAGKKASEAAKAYYKTPLGKIDKAKDNIKSVKDHIKDKLGYDEKERMDYANEQYWKNNRFNPEDVIETHEDYKRVEKEKREGRQKWGAEYTKAKKEFMKTPLGVYTAAKDAIEMAAYDVEKAVKKTGDKVKDTVHDVAFDIEYSTKRNLGIYQKQDRDYYAANVEIFTEKLKRTLAPTDRLYTEQALKRAKESLKEAEKAYNGTPLHKIESGLEYISNLFKRKKRG